MINEKDVIRMLVPFPNISSGLALKPHMYICRQNNHPNYEFVECQTLKPAMIGSAMFQHFVDEPADITRNPFAHTSRIDCDYTFTTASVSYSDQLKTTTRPDVCQDLYDKVKAELLCDGYTQHPINEDDLTSLNRLIHKN